MKMLNTNTRYKKKKIFFISLSVLFVAILLSSFVTSTFAGEAEDEYDSVIEEDGELRYNTRKRILEESSDVGALLATAWDMDSVVNGSNPSMSFMKAAASITAIKSIEFNYKVDGVEKNITISSLAGKAYKILLPVGMALMVLYFLIETLNDVQLDSFTVEKFVRRLLILAIGILVLMYGAEIFSTIIDFADKLCEEIQNVVYVSGGGDDLARETWIKLYNAGHGGGIWNAMNAVLMAIGVMLKNLVTWLLMWLAIVFIYVIAYSRLVELTTRFILAPIGCASLVSSGQQGPAHSTGMRYIKKFASVCLQGVVIVAGVGGAAIVQGAIKNAGGVNSVLGAILIPVALIGFCTRTQQIADDVVGV